MKSQMKAEMRYGIALVALGYSLTVLLWLSSCSQGVSVKLQKNESRFAAVSSNATRVAKPGEQVKITGTGFDSNRSYVARFKSSDGSNVDAEVIAESTSEAYFVMPDGLGLGEKSYEINQGKKSP